MLDLNLITFEVQKRFWKYVLPIDKIDDCWYWSGLKDKDGYGKFTLNKKTYRPHRFLYQLYYNVILRQDQLVCHRCDIRSCVNPNHMFIGSSQDNLNDMVNKGRSLYGEKSPFSKIKESDILNIFHKFINLGMTATNLAKEYSVSETTISYILKRKSWSFVQLPFDYTIDDYYKFSKKNNLNSISNGKRISFRKRFANHPDIYNQISEMLKTHTKSDVCNFFDINRKTLTSLINSGKV